VEFEWSYAKRWQMQACEEGCPKPLLWLAILFRSQR